jgi:hypothetical protein
MGVACSTNGREKERRVLVGKRPLGRPRRRRVNNIKMDLLEIGLGCVDWIDMAQDRGKCRAGKL